jgi:hypothetical protein
VPQPSSGQLHIDHLLTNMALMYSQKAENFVADKAFPLLPVNHKSDDYLIYEKGTFYRAGQMEPRAPGQEPPEAGYETAIGSYSAKEWSLQTSIDDTERANADNPVDVDLAATTFLQTQSMINRDTLWASAYFKTGVWGNSDQTGVASAPSTNQFVQFDQSGATPIETVRGQAITMESGTGYRPNVVVFGAKAYEGFLLSPEVADRVKYTQMAQGYFGNPKAAIAAILEVEKVLVARSVSNTAAENQADSIGYISDPRSILLTYAAPAPSIKQPSAGYTFAWTGLIPGAGNAAGGVIMRGRRELAHSDVLQIRGAYDQRAVATDLGVFFTAAVSSTYAG